MWELSAGVFMGWSLGSNDSANIFGTGVAANILKYRIAIILISVFVIVGALAEGEKCFATVAQLSTLDDRAPFLQLFQQEWLWLPALFSDFLSPPHRPSSEPY